MSELHLDVSNANGGVVTPRISIIVPTRNRVEKLARCLARIGAVQSDAPWELIVVDNGSTDEPPQFLDNFVRRSPIPTRLVTEPTAGGMRSRNAGAESARGEILIFLDNDCYPQSDIVEQYDRIFQDPAIGFAGGRILPYDRAQDVRAERTLALMESEVEIPYPAGR